MLGAQLHLLAAATARSCNPFQLGAGASCWHCHRLCLNWQADVFSLGRRHQQQQTGLPVELLWPHPVASNRQAIR
jgi:hypothetical protein